MPAALVKSFAKKSGKSVEDVEKMWKDVKASLVKQGDDVDDDKFYAKLVGIMKKNLKLESIEADDTVLFDIFKNHSLMEDDDDDDDDIVEHYNAVATLRNVIEVIQDKDDPEGDAGEEGELDPALEILHELAPHFDQETIELIIDGLFEYYLDDDDEDEEDFDESLEEFYESDLGLLKEKVNAVQAKRLRFLKAKRRKQLGKRGNSMNFKRTHHFDNKKKKFVKRKKALSVSAMRKKARIFKKVKRKGSTKAKAKRMKKRLAHVHNPYGH